MNTFPSLRRAFCVAAALASFTTVQAQIAPGTPFFYAGGQQYPLTEASGWIAVRVDEGASPAAVEMAIAAAVPIDPSREGVYHSRYRILVQPVLDTAASAAQLQQSAATVDGVESLPVRMFHNGRLSPIIETEEFLIQFTPDIPSAEIDEVLAQNGAEVARPLGSYAPNGFVARMRDAQGSSIETANKLHGLRGVIYSHPNFIWPKEEKFVPNDPLYNQQWHLKNSGSNGTTGGVAGADIKAERAWDITRGSSSVVVAIVDDGVNTTHEDFNSTNKIQAGWDFVDNDNTPFPDPAIDSNPDSRFHNNHGTACAGLAVANGNNSLGVTGVAPGSRLMSVRLLGANQTPETEAAAISSARDNGATVISNSWGPPDNAGANGTSIKQACPDNVSAAIRDVATKGRGGKGCIVIWAAGNGNEDVDLDGYASHPDVICVAATTNQDIKSSYSDFGDAIDISAPGGPLAGDMTTTDRMGSVGYAAGNYTTAFNGTSAATPVVAGVAALLLSKEPNLTREQLTQRLIDTADFIDTANGDYNSDGHSQLYGFGRVNAWKALAHTDNTKPTVTIRVPSDNVTASNLTAADGTASDTGLGVYRVEVALENSGRWWDWTAGGWSAAGVLFHGPTHGKNATVSSGSWSVALPGNLGAGSYRLHAKAVDKADNESPYISSAFTIDPTGPGLVILEPQDGHNYPAAPQASGVAGDNIKEKRFALFRETDGLWFNWNAGSFDSATFDYSKHVKSVLDTIESWTFNLPSLTKARYQLHGMAIDATDRGSDWFRRDFRIGLPPVVRVNSPGHRTGIQDLTSINGEAEDPSARGLQDNAVKFTLYNDGSYWNGTAWTSTQTTLSATVNGGSWSYSSVPSGSNERSGEYFVSAFVRDNTGALSTSTIGVNQTSFVIDRKPPQVAISSPADGSTITTKNFQFRGTASDAGGVQGVYVFVRRASDYTYWNGTSWGSAPVVLGTNHDQETGEWVSSGGLPALGGNSAYQMANGTYNFIAIAIDHAGNQQQTDSVVTIDFHEIFTYTAGSFSDGISGNDNHYWNNPRNWNPIGVPTPQDIAIIANHHVRSAEPITVYGFRMLSGALDFDNSAHTLTILKTGTWTGGTLVDVTNIHRDATIEISGGGVKQIGHAGVINNFGTAVWNGSGPIQGYQNAVWNNKAGSNFMAAADGDVFANYYGGNVFNNEADAAFIKVAGATDASSYLDEWTFHNAGRIESQEGTLHFNLTLNLNPGSNFAGLGRILLNGTTNLATMLTSTGNAEFVNTLNGNTPEAGFSGNTPIVWSSGTINGRFTLAAGSVLDLTSGNVKQLGYGSVFSNHGEVNWKSGLLRGYQHSVFNNEAGASFKLATDGDVFANYYGGNVFNNKAGAVFVKSGKSDNPDDISHVDEWSFNNSGAIRSDNGVLRFHAPLHLQPGGTISRHGETGARVRSTHHLVLTGTTTISNITFEAGGDWYGNTAEGSAGNGTIATGGGGLFEWTAGTAYNTVNIAPGAAFAISGSDLKQIGYAAVVNNSGQAVWSGTGPIQGYQHATFANLAGATFAAQSDADLVNYYGGNKFVNAAGATFRKTGGTENNRVDWAFLNNGTLLSSSGAIAMNGGGSSSGTFVATTPGLVQFTAGHHDLITTAKFEGTGKTQVTGGTLQAVNDVEGDSTAGVFEIAGGTVTSAANGSFNAVGNISWTGGAIAGVFNVKAGSTMQLTGDQAKLIGGGGVINNSGTAVWSGPGPLQGYQNSTWNNKPGSSFTATTDGDVFANHYGGNTFRNEANAAFIKTAGASNSSSYLDEWTFHNAGQLDSREGTLHINLTLNLNPGSSLAGAGRILLAGTTNLATKLTSTGNPEFVDTLNGNTPDAGFSGTNPFVWSNGTINGRFSLAAGSVLDLTTGNVKQIGYDSIFTNHGQVNWKAGLLRGYQNSTFNNESGSIFNVITDGDVFANYYGGNVFNNKAGALFVKSGRSANQDDISFVDEWTFNNSGAIRSDSGVLRFHTALHLLPGGTIARDGDVPARVRSTHYFVLFGTTTVSNIVFEAAGDWHGNMDQGTSGNGTIATANTGVFEWTAGTAHNIVNIAPGTAFAISGDQTKQIGYAGLLKNGGLAVWTGNGVIQGYQNSTFANLAGATFVAATDADFVNYYGGNKFTNGGNFVVSPSLGVTDIVWDYEQSSTGLLHMHLAGVNAATPEFDQLKVHGRATLAGILSINLLNQYVPVPDTTYRVMTFGSRAGSFGLVHSLGSVMKLEYNANNLTLVAKEHAETNTEWKQYFFGDPTAPEAQPLADPNGDGLPNLIAYALGKDPLARGGLPPFSVGSGADVDARAFGASTDAAANGLQHLVFSYTRPAGSAALKDISYSVQRETSLATSNWSVSDVVQQSTVASADGLKETVTMRSAHALGATPAEFLRLTVALTTPGGESASSDPVGATTVSIAANGAKALSFALDNMPTFIGAASGVTADALQSVDAGWTANAFGPYDSKPHIVRMLSGSSAGRQFRVASNTADAVTVATGGIDLTSVMANGDRFEIIPVDSLATLLGATAPELTRNRAPGSADNVQVRHSLGWFTYFNDGAQWLRQGAGETSQNNVTLSPEQGVVFVHRGDAAMPFSLTGVVPMTNLKTDLPAGKTTMLGNRFPQATTLSGLGLHTTAGWTAHANPASADQVLIREESGWKTYYHDGTNWLRDGAGATPQNPEIGIGQAVLVVRRPGVDLTLDQPRPY